MAMDIRRIMSLAAAAAAFLLNPEQPVRCPTINLTPEVPMAGTLDGKVTEESAGKASQQTVPDFEYRGFRVFGEERAATYREIDPAKLCEISEILLSMEKDGKPTWIMPFYDQDDYHSGDPDVQLVNGKHIHRQFYRFLRSFIPHWQNKSKAALQLAREMSEAGYSPAELASAFSLVPEQQLDSYLDYYRALGDCHSSPDITYKAFTKEIPASKLAEARKNRIGRCALFSDSQLADIINYYDMGAANKLAWLRTNKGKRVFDGKSIVKLLGSKEGMDYALGWTEFEDADGETLFSGQQIAYFASKEHMLKDKVEGDGSPGFSRIRTYLGRYLSAVLELIGEGEQIDGEAAKILMLHRLTKERYHAYASKMPEEHRGALVARAVSARFKPEDLNPEETERPNVLMILAAYDYNNAIAASRYDYEELKRYCDVTVRFAADDRQVVKYLGEMRAKGAIAVYIAGHAGPYELDLRQSRFPGDNHDETRYLDHRDDELKDALQIPGLKDVVIFGCNAGLLEERGLCRPFLQYCPKGTRVLAAKEKPVSFGFWGVPFESPLEIKYDGGLHFSFNCDSFQGMCN